MVLVPLRMDDDVRWEEKEKKNLKLLINLDESITDFNWMYDRTYVLVYYYYLICILSISPFLLHCYPESEPIALAPITCS